MALIKTEIWKPDPARPGVVVFDKQRKAQDIFDELEAHLIADGRLPDEYFLLKNSLWGNGELFPRDAEILCNVNYGGSEGIYLDISVRYAKDVYEHDSKTGVLAWHRRMVAEPFVTGKTLGESIADLDTMNLSAASVIAAFDGGKAEVHERYAKVAERAKLSGVEAMSRSDLIDVIMEYDKYIQNANDDNRYREGWFPVCINEFIDNEYQAIAETPQRDHTHLIAQTDVTYASVQDLGKSSRIKGLLGETMSTVECYEAENHGIFFDYDGAIGLLEQVQALVAESARCPRPANLPPDIPWCEKLYDGDDSLNPYVFDGTMSEADYEKMHELIAEHGEGEELEV